MGGGGGKKPKFDMPNAAANMQEAPKPLLQEQGLSEETVKARENQRNRAQAMLGYKGSFATSPLEDDENKNKKAEIPKTLLGD